MACEESGRVREAFARRGHNAWSCDLEPTAIPGQHRQGDVLEFLEETGDDYWDLMIAHPVCRYLANSGAKHLYKGMKKENGENPERFKLMRKGAKFYLALRNRKIKRRAIENPVMHGHAMEIIKPGHRQFIQPWQFGHKEMKATGLELINLPDLVPTNVVGPPPADAEERRKWQVVWLMGPGPDREKLRSRTYEGVAEAMASQWGPLLPGDRG